MWMWVERQTLLPLDLWHLSCLWHHLKYTPERLGVWGSRVILISSLMVLMCKCWYLVLFFHEHMLWMYLNLWEGLHSPEFHHQLQEINLKAFSYTWAFFRAWGISDISCISSSCPLAGKWFDKVQGMKFLIIFTNMWHLS